MCETFDPYGWVDRIKDGAETIMGMPVSDEFKAYVRGTDKDVIIARCQDNGIDFDLRTVRAKTF